MCTKTVVGAALVLSLALSAACSSQPEPPVQAAATAERQTPAAPAAPTGATRMERDLLGEKAVPADAYYGVQTARALENFHISGVHLALYPNLIKAFAMVKMAAARANWRRDPWPTPRIRAQNGTGVHCSSTASAR